MNNHAYRLDYLYRQYIQKACTWEELQEFFDYVADPAWQERLAWLADQHIEELSVPEQLPAIDWEYMYGKIMPQAAHSRKGEVRHEQSGLFRRMLVRYSAAAAILILVLGLAGYYFLVADKEDDAGSTAQYYVRQDDKKAILVPDNDTVMVLDSVADGVVEWQVFNKTTKEQVGKPVYHGGYLCIDTTLLDTFPSRRPDSETATLIPDDDIVMAVDRAVNNAPEERMYNTVGMKWMSKLAAIYSVLSTPSIGKDQLVLPDSSKVWLNAASSVRYSTLFTGYDRVVEVAGEVYFEVVKGQHLPFKVVIRSLPGGGWVEVLGSDFAINVNAYDEDVIIITLLEGEVKVIRDALSTIVLHPGQQAQVTKSNGIGLVKDVDVGEVVAWKKAMK